MAEVHTEIGNLVESLVQDKDRNVQNYVNILGRVDCQNPDCIRQSQIKNRNSKGDGNASRRIIIYHA